MNTKAKLEEARDILEGIITGPRDDWPVGCIRAHHLVESALADFFTDENDVASIPLWFEDEPPQPAA